MMKQTDQNSPQRTSARSRRKTTRREFLTTSTAIVASTFAAPAILRARGVSEKLNIAVIGSGGRATKICGIPENFFAGPIRDVSQVIGFGEPTRILKITSGFQIRFAGTDPFRLLSR